MSFDPNCEPREPSIRRRLWSALWQQPLWAIPFAVFFGLMYGGRWESFVTAYRFSLVYAFVIRLSLEAMEAFVLPRFGRSGNRRGPSLPISIALYSGTSILASYGAALIIQQTVMPGMLGSARSILINGAFAIVFSTLFGGVAYAIHYYRESMRQARAIEGMRVELAQAELRALRAQLQPHFLFNTLNSIASLIPSNPVAAEEMTTRLADIFRYALRASERELAPLCEELDFLRAYLDIERARFGDRLTVEERIEPGLAALSVPTLLLQPLVENAVRHGIAARPGGGRLVIVARRAGDALELAVEDDGPGFDPAAPGDPSGNGFGLHSVRERLRAAGLVDALSIDTSPGRGTRVTVTLPLDGTVPPGPSPS
jgi:signal transduction histidine kinase